MSDLLADTLLQLLLALLLFRILRVQLIGMVNRTFVVSQQLVSLLRSLLGTVCSAVDDQTVSNLLFRLHLLLMTQNRHLVTDIP